jgi:hypothetical protein
MPREQHGVAAATDADAAGRTEGAWALTGGTSRAFGGSRSREFREVWVGDLMRHEGEQISQRATVCDAACVAAHPGIGESVGGVKVPAASRGVPSVYSG